jgi:hypothetical protein
MKEARKPISLHVDGKTRVIRDVRANTDREFEASYRGCQITITPMGERDPKEEGRRLSLEVRAADGCMIVDTWEYAKDFSREDLLRKAISNILSSQ